MKKNANYYLVRYLRFLKDEMSWTESDIDNEIRELTKFLKAKKVEALNIKRKK